MNFNFALILFWLLVGSGLIWFAELIYFGPRRRVAAAIALQAFDDHQKARQIPSGPDQAAARELVREKALRQPGWIEFCGGLFPVILVVFVLRSFLFEPFKIPSGSMMPTLIEGDLILVNKYAYGIRLPVLNKKVIDVGDPQRGDVMVFRYPRDPSEDYIKRVIGLPGDRITYQNKQLAINGHPVPLGAPGEYYDERHVVYTKQLDETLPAGHGTVEHKILNDDAKSVQITPDNFDFRENCQYFDGNTAITCTVPPGHYFMMGDNRDNSMDSRYWGFVPDENIVGRAFFIWMNFGNIKRIGPFH